MASFALARYSLSGYVLMSVSMLSRLNSNRLCCRSFSARSYKSLSASADSFVSGLEAVVFLAAQPAKSITARIAAGQLYVACIRFRQPFLLFAPKPDWLNAPSREPPPPGQRCGIPTCRPPKSLRLHGPPLPHFPVRSPHPLRFGSYDDTDRESPATPLFFP